MEDLTINHHNYTSQQETTTTTRELPLELISEILHRLPAKPVSRFKCVSKAWLSLITSRHFILLHVTHSLSTSSNLHVTRLGRSTLATLHLPTPDNIKTINLPFSTRAPDSDIVGSCHGLVCVSDHPNFLAIVNPTTRTYHIVPVRVPRQKSESHWVDFGLGYDRVCDKYKVVRIDQRNGPGYGARPREVRVYTMENGGRVNKWSKADVEFPNFLAQPKGHGKYLNNSLHWMCTTVTPKVYDIGTCLNRGTAKDKTVYKYVIVVFELSKETFCEIELPFSNSWLKKKRLFPKPVLVVLAGKLGVQVEYGEENKGTVELWLMREYKVKDSWVTLFTFPYDQVRGGINKGRVTPLMMIKKGLEMEEVLMEQNGTKQVVYFWYNVKSGRIRDVEVDGYLPALLEWRGGHICNYGGVICVDSLVALNNFGLVHAQPPENPAEDTTDDINREGVLPMGSFRGHSQEVVVHRPDLGRYELYLV